MQALLLLALTALLYAGYNLLIKQSAAQTESLPVHTITATIALQLAALLTSCVYLLALRLQGAGAALWLPPAAYGWAIAAGLCIGAAEICYFLLYAGVGGAPPLPVAVVTPAVVGGAVALALFAAWAVFGESLGWPQLAGGVLVIAGVALSFARG